MGWLLIVLVALWVLGGYLVFRFGTRPPNRAGKSLSRTASHRLALVGDRIQVDLACSSAGVPLLPREKREPWDIMLVIDHSSSMGEGPGSALDETCKARSLARVTAHAR